MAGIVGQLPVVLVGAALIALAVRDVTRARLERFARRQGLLVTVDNGPYVIDYLAATRRWRVAGFVAGVLIAFGCTFTQRNPWNVGGAGALVGWFGGAVVAEWRLRSRRATGARRAALLAARRLSDYLPRSLIAANVVVWFAAIVLGAVLVVDIRPSPASVAFGLAAVIVTAPAIALVGRHILARSQPLAAPDVLAADDALRSRSLHVLAGSTLAINGLLAALIESAKQATYSGWASSNWAMVVDLVGALVLPILGWLAATAPYRARQTSRVLGIAA